MTTLAGKDVLRADQFTKPEIERVLDVAAKYEKALVAGKILSTLRGKVLATRFF